MKGRQQVARLRLHLGRKGRARRCWERRAPSHQLVTYMVSRLFSLFSRNYYVNVLHIDGAKELETVALSANSLAL